jgi:ABC-2 type transport system permease protein
MLWYKAWLETRWRFLIGLALLVCSAAGIVLFYPRVMRELLPLATDVNTGGVVGRQIREAADLMSTYRGYVWSQWFRQDMAQNWSICAALLGTGGLLSRASRGGAIYTLSMPVSRTQLLGVRAATALGELLVLAVVPSLALPLLSPLVGQSYGVGDVLVYSACLFLAGSMFFSLAFLLSTVFSDMWRPALITICAMYALGSIERLFHDVLPLSLFHVMGAESYFRGSGVPWIGLLARVAVSAGLLYGADVIMSRRDF